MASRTDGEIKGTEPATLTRNTAELRSTMPFWGVNFTARGPRTKLLGTSIWGDLVPLSVGRLLLLTEGLKVILSPREVTMCATMNKVKLVSIVCGTDLIGARVQSRRRAERLDRKFHHVLGSCTRFYHLHITHSDKFVNMKEVRALTKGIRHLLTWSNGIES